jgi:cytochrome c-type biogenesis protein CcmH
VLLWLLIALMTGAAIFAVLAPLSRAAAAGPQDGGAAGRIYRDQLRELESEAALGRIPATEAASARAEIARRLIAAESDAAAERPMPGNLGARRAAALVALTAIPILSLGLYAMLGNPGLAGQPLAARLSAPAADSDLASLVARVEDHLAKTPEDGRGWEVIAPVYLRLERPADAVRAYRNAVRLLGSTATRQNGLGQALFMESGGIVTQEAREAFAAATAADPAAPEPKFFLGLAAEQDGRPAEAAAIWRALLAGTTADSAWHRMLEASLARVEPALAESGPSAEQVAEAVDLPAADRDAMIEGMVAGLADRLKREPGDVDGWLRLIRSYAVLGRRAEAAEAAAAALASANDAAQKARIEALMAELGIAAPAASIE